VKNHALDKHENIARNTLLTPGPSSKVYLLNKVISEILFSLYLENMDINCHETCQKAKLLPQQQPRKVSNNYHKVNQI